MTAKSPNLGTWISGVLLLGAWIFQDYFGSESQSLESEINRFEVALSLLDISDQLTDTQDFVGDLLEVSVENRSSMQSIPDEEAVYNNRKWNLRTSINVEKVSEALSSRQGTRFLLLFANYKFQPAIDKVYEFLRVEDLFGDRLSEMADQTETLKYPDYDSLNQLEYSLQELRAERSLSTEKYIKDNNTNALLITQDLMDRRDNAEKWSKLCQVLTFIFFVSGSLLGIMNQLRIPSSAGVKEGEQGRDADC